MNAVFPGEPLSETQARTILFQNFLKDEKTPAPMMPDAPRNYRLEAELLAADAMGDIIEHWGFRKCLGRIWTVLFLAGEPLPAAVIGERLQMSAGGVNTAMHELQRWAVVKRVWKPGERKDYFEAETDFWRMISKVFEQREKLLGESVLGRLQRAQALLDQAPRGSVPQVTRDRLRRLLAFILLAKTTLDAFIASRRVDLTGFGDLVRFPLEGLRRLKEHP